MIFNFERILVNRNGFILSRKSEHTGLCFICYDQLSNKFLFFQNIHHYNFWLNVKNLTTNRCMKKLWPSTSYYYKTDFFELITKTSQLFEQNNKNTLITKRFPFASKLSSLVLIFMLIVNPYNVLRISRFYNTRIESQRMGIFLIHSFQDTKNRARKLLSRGASLRRIWLSSATAKDQQLNVTFKRVFAYSASS